MANDLLLHSLSLRTRSPGMHPTSTTPPPWKILTGCLGGGGGSLDHLCKRSPRLSHALSTTSLLPQPLLPTILQGPPQRGAPSPDVSPLTTAKARTLLPPPATSLDLCHTRTSGIRGSRPFPKARGILPCSPRKKPKRPARVPRASFSRNRLESISPINKQLSCDLKWYIKGSTTTITGFSKHEIVGIVKEIGSNVKSFKLGDHAGVGTYVNSCRQCDYCNDKLEVHCSKAVYTFNGIDVDGTITKGGYSSYITVHERYCYRIPDEYPLALAAPLLCAGITVYTPMMRHKMNQAGKSLGVIGLGGLGHMAVKFGKAFGLNVIVFSTSISKKDDALNLLGADNFVVTSDEQQMQALSSSLDFIIDTASGDHPFDLYMPLLKIGGVLVLVGFPSEVRLSPASLILGARTISGSVTGGTKDTQEMLDFCAANKIYPEVEVIDIQSINEALQRLIDKDVKYRFVIDIENSLK